ELVILKKILNSLELLKESGEIGMKTYTVHKKDLDKKLITVKFEISEMLKVKDMEMAQKEMVKILKRYCLHIESATYSDLFKKEIITESVLSNLNFCIDQQKIFLEESLPQFKNGENSFYKQIFDFKNKNNLISFLKEKVL